MTYMLDTNICIYAMKNKPEHVLQRLKKELNSGICISSITLAELEYGMKHSSNPAKNEQALLRFLIPLSILPFGAAAASEYGEIRSYLKDRGTPIGPLDMLIAAHARSEDCFHQGGSQPQSGQAMLHSGVPYRQMRIFLQD